MAILTCLLALGLSQQANVARSVLAGKEPQVAIGADHTVYVAYGDANGRVFVARSGVEPHRYTEPVLVGTLPKLALGMRRGPKIVVNESAVVVTAISHQTGNLVAFRSTDRGKTWSHGTSVNDVPSSAREGLHAMAAGTNGSIFCAWLDLRSTGTKLYGSVSKDGGLKWTPNRLIYESPGGSICECCTPTVGIDSEGLIYVMFRNSIEGYRDMYLTTSADGGSTFRAARKLGRGTWKLDGCPMDGGAFVLTNRRECEPIWRREGTLYRGGLMRPESMFAEGQQASAASTPKGLYFSWTAGRRILVQTPTTKVMEVSADGNDSVVATSPDGELVVVAWTDGNGKSVTILPIDRAATSP